MSVIDSYSENCGFLHIVYVSAIYNRATQNLEGCNKLPAL